MTPEQKGRCSEILNHFGCEAQVVQACQELGELQEALLGGDEEQIVDEIADAKIMIQQMEESFYIYSQVKARVEKKLTLTELRIRTGFYDK
ncbi:MAG: hypothetical protein COA36_11670 [Desulfotalea sp.]|nr:MAG: hypothetical protein COA36_11670 [Desulfotalea sp.]